MDDWKKAISLLDSEGYTCVACKGELCHTTTARGVRPLVQWLESGTDLTGFCTADKVVGKATAFLYCLLGVQAVYAQVMSTAAKETLIAHGITAACGKEVPGIINRKGDGPCPFEAAVWHIDQPQQALEAIVAKQKEMGLR